MWHDKLEAFWDGSETLVLGLFGVPDPTDLFPPNSELQVISCTDAAFRTEVTLLDLIDIGSSSTRHWTLTLPQQHDHVLLRSSNGEEIALHLVNDEAQISGGEWRLLMTELATADKGPEHFRVATAAATADRGRFIGAQIDRTTDRIVWAVIQKRRSERRAGAMPRLHISPSDRVWPPKESHVAIEAMPSVRPRLRGTQQGPFALLDHWQRDNPSAVVMRITITDDGNTDDNGLARLSLVHLMHQRRYLTDWNEKRRNEADPIVEPLSISDIRIALGEPDETPDAVESSDWISVVPLSQVLSVAEATDFDGFTLRRIQKQGAGGLTTVADIEFFGAALGDDIGIASNWARDGEITTSSADPGGSVKARFFRIELAGLAPIPIHDSDPTLNEILGRVGDLESVAAAPAAAQARGGRPSPQSEFVGRLKAQFRNDALASSIDTYSRWGDLAPLVMAEFTAVAHAGGLAAEDALQQLGAYSAFHADPPIARAVASDPEVVGDVSSTVLARHHNEFGHLARRLAVLRGTPDMVEPELPLQSQIQGWQLLAGQGLARLFTDTRIAFDRADGDIDAIRQIVDRLSERGTVQQSANSHEDLGRPTNAELLRDYLHARGRGRWTPLTQAGKLAGLVESSIEHWENEPPPEPLADPAIDPDTRKPPELHESIAALFRQAHHQPPKPMEPARELARLERDYEQRKSTGKLDRYVLRDFERKIRDIIDQPEEDLKVEELISRLENWAGLPQFLRTVAPRLHHGIPRNSNKRVDLLQDYISRTHPSVPKRDGRSTAFDRHRETLESRIREKSSADKYKLDTKLVDEIVGYGDILLFHQAYRAIDESLPSLSRSPEFSRLQNGLKQWPSKAAQTLDYATAALQQNSAQLDRINALLSPPPM